MRPRWHYSGCYTIVMDLHGAKSQSLNSICIPYWWWPVLLPCPDFVSIMSGTQQAKEKFRFIENRFSPLLAISSDFIVSPVSMSEAFICQIGAYALPCFVHSMRCTWIFGRLGLPQFEQDSKLLHSALMDGFGHNGTLCTAICVRIFHVSTLGRQFELAFQFGKTSEIIH